ncbi:hypothetical protein D041_0798A, partial [Vibrio parahaemolyticus EKP-008]
MLISGMAKRDIGVTTLWLLP